MRLKFVLIVGVVSLGFVSPAFAYEKYIPLGAGYATGTNVLPELNSEESAFTVQTDIYETELYRQQLEKRRNQSYLSNFSSNHDVSTSDFIDY